MGELVPSQETDLQTLAAEYSTDGFNVKEAAEKLGLSIIDMKKVLNQDGTRRAMSRYREAKLKGEMAGTALRVLQKMMDSGPPPQALRAAITVLAIAGHLRDDDASARRTLEEMSYDELQAIVRQVDGENDRRASEATPVARSAG